MFDTDSLGSKNYFSGNQADMMTARKLEKRVKLNAFEFCDEALYALIFYLLSLGDAPLDEEDGSFKYDRPQYIARFRKNFFPSRVWAHMERVYRGETPPSPAALLPVMIHCERHSTASSRHKSSLPNRNPVLFWFRLLGMESSPRFFRFT